MMIVDFSSNNSSFSYEHISAPVSRAASPPGSPSEFANIDELMSDAHSNISLHLSSSNSGIETESSDDDSDSMIADEGKHASDGHASITESIVLTDEHLDGTNADDEESSSDGSESGVNGSPRLFYRGSLSFEGNIWNHMAEADDGISEVNEGFHMRLIVSDLRWSIAGLLKHGLRGRLGQIVSLLGYHTIIELRRKITSYPNSPHSDRAEAVDPPETPLDESEGEEIQIDNYLDIGSPMSLDLCTDDSDPGSSLIQSSSEVSYYPATFPDLAFTSPPQNPSRTRASPEFPHRYRLPSSRHHPYARTT
ncbi:hypothetical protein FRC12_013879 [Ceratobasidium sp. 428]|nr:hypothetical protein FRC12_013879 [Ceratobasidium sp. 428]